MGGNIENTNGKQSTTHVLNGNRTCALNAQVQQSETSVVCHNSTLTSSNPLLRGLRSRAKELQINKK